MRRLRAKLPALVHRPAGLVSARQTSLASSARAASAAFAGCAAGVAATRPRPLARAEAALVPEPAPAPESAGEVLARLVRARHRKVPVRQRSGWRLWLE